MDKYFRTEEGKLVDIVDYTIDQMKKNPHVRIYIGTDSQVKGSSIEYVPCIVYRAGNRGGHFIYKRVRKPRPPRTVSKDDQVNMRLTEEVYLTMEIAEFMSVNSSIHIEAVEFDFNHEPEHISNRITSMATGWAMGLGFKARIKPQELIACRASDHLCRR